MVEVKPMLQAVQPWDATKGTNFYFTYTGHRQALKNHLLVTDVKTNAVAYSFEWSSFEKTHPIAPNVLTNGKEYKAQLRVKFADGSYSAYSNEIKFRTFATPVLDIVSIDGQGYVYNRDVTFVAVYSQKDSEKVKTYRFSLYDESEDLIKHYPVREHGVGEELSELIKDLEKSKGYFIECSIETVNGMVYTHRERFIPMYLVPAVNGVILTENDEDEGFVRIKANLKQIVGNQIRSKPAKIVKYDGTPNDDDDYDSDNYDYIDNEWIIIPKDKPLMFHGLEMNRASDFVMKVWCKNIPNDKKFMEISPIENQGIAIQLWKYADRIVVVKELNNITSRHRSNILTLPNDASYMVYLRVIEHRIDVSVQIL